MKATVRLSDESRVVEVSADLYDEDGEVTDDVRYDNAVEQLRNLIHALVSATYGYHHEVE